MRQNCSGGLFCLIFFPCDTMLYSLMRCLAGSKIKGIYLFSEAGELGQYVMYTENIEEGFLR